MSKSRDAFRTISEVADWLETPAHVLRFWESKFSQVKPVKRAGGRRYYRPSDMDLLSGIKKLLHEDGMTIKGVQKVLREQGVRHVSGLTAVSADPSNEMDGAMIEDAPYVEVPLEADPDPVIAFPRDPADAGRTAEDGHAPHAPEMANDAAAHTPSNAPADARPDDDKPQEAWEIGGLNPAAPTSGSDDTDGLDTEDDDDDDDDDTHDSFDDSLQTPEPALADETMETMDVLDETADDIPAETADAARTNVQPPEHIPAEPQDEAPQLADTNDAADGWNTLGTPELPFEAAPPPVAPDIPAPVDAVEASLDGADSPVTAPLQTEPIPQEPQDDLTEAQPQNTPTEIIEPPVETVSRPVDLQDFDAPAAPPKPQAVIGVLGLIAGVSGLSAQQAQAVAAQLPALKARRDRLSNSSE
jgi:DNA-binding transcriptional MerR regulator